MPWLLPLLLALCLPCCMSYRMKPIFFPHHHDFRKWLQENHTTATELFVGYYKISSGKQSMSYPESVDQALCFGWIDGIRRSIDGESYMNRFTPRKTKNSSWSAVNIAKVTQLIEQGAMTPAGLAAFERREPEAEEFSDEFLAALMANAKGWRFFEEQANWYKKQKIHWVMSAKQETTRQSRLAKLIAANEKSEKI